MRRPKYELLKEIIAGSGQVAVAFSGGVDSTLLAKAASEVVGPELPLLFANSELLPLGEARWAEELARHIGGRLIAVEVAPLADPAFVANPPQRCYLCKRGIYTALLAVARARGVTTLLDGTNLDDLQTDRPGLRALAELGIVTPLVAAELGKREIRALSRELGLPTWNKPSASCLATRIPAQTPITRERLRTIGQGEEYLRGLGFAGCRLRLGGEGEAVVELLANGIARFLATVSLPCLHREFAALGIKKIFLALAERPGVFL